MLEILHYDVHRCNRYIVGTLRLSHGTVGQCIQRFNTAGGTWPLREDQSDRKPRQWLYPGNLGQLRGVTYTGRPMMVWSG